VEEKTGRKIKGKYEEKEKKKKEKGYYRHFTFYTVGDSPEGPLRNRGNPA
jgi:guanyl-specific ribonuclease Sa